MRRGLTLLSVGLVLVGLELSTEALSLTAARLAAGLRALASGTEFVVGTGSLVAGLVLIAAGVGLVGLLAWSGRERIRIETVGRTCPGCGNETIRVRRKLRHRLLSRLLQEGLTRRQCGQCGWTGLALKR